MAPENIPHGILLNSFITILAYTYMQLHCNTEPEPPAGSSLVSYRSPRTTHFKINVPARSPGFCSRGVDLARQSGGMVSAQMATNDWQPCVK